MSSASQISCGFSGSLCPCRFRGSCISFTSYHILSRLLVMWLSHLNGLLIWCDTLPCFHLLKICFPTQSFMLPSLNVHLAIECRLHYHIKQQPLFNKRAPCLLGIKNSFTCLYYRLLLLRVKHSRRSHKCCFGTADCLPTVTIPSPRPYRISLPTRYCWDYVCFIGEWTLQLQSKRT